VSFRPPSRPWIALLACLLGELVCAGNAIAADPGAEARRLYQQRCGGCHSVETDRIGPRHRGVIGRLIASVPDYEYSPALKQLSGVWTPMRLDLWLSGTQKMAPGSKMYLALDDVNQRRLIIGYLQSISEPETSK
jgi:cytochrome c